MKWVFISLLLFACSRWIQYLLANLCLHVVDGFCGDRIWAEIFLYSFSHVFVDKFLKLRRENEYTKKALKILCYDCVRLFEFRCIYFLKVHNLDCQGALTLSRCTWRKTAAAISAAKTTRRLMKYCGQKMTKTPPSDHYEWNYHISEGESRSAPAK